MTPDLSNPITQLAIILLSIALVCIVVAMFSTVKSSRDLERAAEDERQAKFQQAMGEMARERMARAHLENMKGAREEILSGADLIWYHKHD